MRTTSLKGKISACLVFSLLGTGILAGCGKSNAAAQDSKVQTIIVGSGNSYVPYCYMDDSGQAVGYEYDVLQAIDELLPQYEFEYKSMNFDNLLLSLDSGKIDIAAHQFEETEERKEKYLFAEESYTSYVTYIGVLTEEDGVNSLEDLSGEKVRTGGVTSASTSILKNWNDEHPGKEIELVTSDGSTDEETAAALKSGAVKASILTKRDIKKLNNNFGNGTEFLKAVGDPINNTSTYYLYRTDETELQTAIDGALKQLKENGELSKLSIKWFDEDVTESE